MQKIGRIDSCRGCGETLEVIKTCNLCEQPSQLKCSNCYHFVDDPIHTNCAILENS